MAEIIYDVGHMEDIEAPKSGGRYTHEEISNLVDGFGGKIKVGGEIKADEFEFEGRDVIVYYRVGGIVEGKLNMMAAAYFNQPYFGTVLVVPVEETPLT